MNKHLKGIRTTRDERYQLEKYSENYTTLFMMSLVIFMLTAIVWIAHEIWDTKLTLFLSLASSFLLVFPMLLMWFTYKAYMRTIKEIKERHANETAE